MNLFCILNYIKCAFNFGYWMGVVDQNQNVIVLFSLSQGFSVLNLIWTGEAGHEPAGP